MVSSKKFTGPDPSEWREFASVAYFKDKLYYLGGKGSKRRKDFNHVNVRISNESP